MASNATGPVDSKPQEAPASKPASPSTPASSPAPKVPASLDTAPPPPPKTLAQQQTETLKAQSAPRPETVDPNPQKAKKPRDYVRVVENVGAKLAFAWHGVCTACGWQSFQPSQKEAGDAVEQHAIRHVLQQ